MSKRHHTDIQPLRDTHCKQGTIGAPSTNRCRHWPRWILPLDIADAMSLSVRTVEGHINRATVEAGVATRDESSSMVKQFDQAWVSSG